MFFFSGFQKIPLRGSDENEISLNPGGLRFLLNYASNLNNDVNKHLKKVQFLKDFHQLSRMNYKNVFLKFIEIKLFLNLAKHLL